MPMKKINLYSAFCAALVVASLSACSGGEVRRNLGLQKQAPDEFMVISRPPLTVPPDFSLVPPGQEHLVPSSIPGEAKSLVFSNGAETGDDAKRSAGEQELLQLAGTGQANPNIRDVLEEERRAAERVVKEKGFLDGIRDALSPGSDDPLIDPDGEEERLTENLRDGKPINEGEPVVQGKGEQKGIINELFDL